MKKNATIVPFMVFEPAKTEYRGIKTVKARNGASARGIEVYTPGNDKISSFRFNPLELLPGIEAEEHIENVLCCFQAAMPMSGPLPALLREALEELYENYSDRKRPPVIRDLVLTAEAILTGDRYSAETRSDIRAALSVRIGVLSRGLIGRVFQCRHSIPSIEHLMTVPSIIEAAILPPEQACLLGLFVFNGIREHLRTTARVCAIIPSYMLFIEEAHNIIGLTSEARPSEENADPKAYATEFICRMMAECGGYGVPIVIIEQLPSAVAPAVVKHAGSFLFFLETDEEDREIAGSSTLASKAQREDFGRLATGEAYIFTGGYHRPQRIRTVNIHTLVDFDKTVGDQQLQAIIRQEEWFRQMACQRIAAELSQLQEYMNDFERQRIETVNTIKRILAHRGRLLSLEAGGRDQGQLRALRSQTRSIQRALEQSFRQFRRGAYRRYMPTDKDLDGAARALRDQLRHQYEKVIEPDVHRLLSFLDDLVRKFIDPESQEMRYAKAQ